MKGLKKNTHYCPHKNKYLRKKYYDMRIIKKKKLNNKQNKRLLIMKK